MKDLIDRQQAIDEFWKLEIEARPSWIDAVMNMLNSLPSAQPEITEDDVKEYCRKRCLIVVTSDFYDEMTRRWASAQPEIIRCKECKYYTPLNAKCEIRGKGLYLIRGMNDFCSRAERRSDG